MSLKGGPEVTQSKFFYGWIIVAACTIIMVIQAGVIYSFGVFFKPLAADFGWSRAATSGVYSILLISNGIFAAPIGWLADRFGHARTAALSSLWAGLGLALTSQVNALWQAYLIFGLMVGIGMAGSYATAVSAPVRWFVKHRGMALGIVASGAGLGTLTIVPLVARLISGLGWSQAYIILGAITGIIMSASSLLLRRNPEELKRHIYRETPLSKPKTSLEAGVTLSSAAHTRLLWMLMSIYFLINVCVHTIMVHLVNCVTDFGIAPIVGATLVSTIGIGSIVGRLAMGTASDKISSNNALIICCTILVASVSWLTSIRELWMFFLFAIVFGFAYGGEVPQMPALVGKFFGLRAVTALVGTVFIGSTTGGALGSWLAGRVFDITQSYQVAFVIAAVASLLALTATIMLKKVRT